ncbi:hypothetical protein F4802DRAFT_599513 [Xylaria palmicola]|nr:hypothetical protein F4802DRAFT_599513 [Xylaria palmicola]
MQAVSDDGPEFRMDPVMALGAVGSVVGIAGFGIQLSQILIQFISQARSAQEHLEEVAAEIDATTSALEEIYPFLEQEVHNVEAGNPLALLSESSLIKVKVTADKCLIVFWLIKTSVAGSEPDGFEDELASRLTSFNRQLASCRPGFPIKIESQLVSYPLGLRDRVRWAFRATKLEKFYKDLQRYQSHLVLLLQIVQNPTEQDIFLMRQTHAFITQIASLEELRSMASEAQDDGEKAWQG